jgi:hypothetical protein
MFVVSEFNCSKSILQKSNYLHIFNISNKILDHIYYNN